MIREFNGKAPQIDPTAFVSEAAYIIGDVTIGPYSSVWPGAIIRADQGPISIGSHTNIQDNSVVHTDVAATIGNYVTLGHRVVCHAALVEDYSLLGNGCVVNEGVSIGSNVIVAAGSMVIERKHIPKGMLAAGVPAVIKGKLFNRHKELILSVSEHYVRLAQQYKIAGL